MLDVANDGFLSGDPGSEAGTGLAPAEAVSAVQEAREEAPAVPPVAERDDYGDFQWPDGYAADPDAMARFVPIAKKLGLAKEAAQELASLYADLDGARRRNEADFIAKNNDEWVREIRNHPEFGGRNLEAAGQDVRAVLGRYGSPRLSAQIRQMNIQNWPEMFFFLARVSRAVSEDRSPSGLSAPAPAKSTAELLFPGLR